MYIGHQGGRCPVLGSRYGISFPRGLFVKNVFRRAKIKKLHAVCLKDVKNEMRQRDKM
jgi:hypothetical protein